MTRPATHKSGRKLYYADMVKFAQGERVQTVEGARTPKGAGYVHMVPYAVGSPCYYVLFDGADMAVIVPEDDLEPEPG